VKQNGKGETGPQREKKKNTNYKRLKCREGYYISNRGELDASLGAEARKRVVMLLWHWSTESEVTRQGNRRKKSPAKNHE